MGITIESKRVSLDLGYAGFNRFRQAVAEQAGKDIGLHYVELNDSSIMMMREKEKDNYFKTYDAKTRDLVAENKLSMEVANFLYQSDSAGKINRKQAKMIYELIKDCDDNIIFGYSGRPDCTKMSDMKRLFSDNTKVEWC